MNAQRGFTLLEVLVAFTILAVIFGALFEVFAVGLATVRKGETYAYATLLAQSKLAELSTGSTFAPGSRSGVFDAGYATPEDRPYRWTFKLTHYREDELGSLDHSKVMPFTATMEVYWEESGREQNVSLNTVVLGTR